MLVVIAYRQKFIYDKNFSIYGIWEHQINNNIQPNS